MSRLTRAKQSVTNSNRIVTIAARHRYQLVFQFRGASLERYDQLVAIEELFTRVLRGSATVDGHDCGCDEFNIFVHTDTPEESFTHIRPVLTAARLLAEVRVACREFGSDTFSIVWPEGDKLPFAVA